MNGEFRIFVAIFGILIFLFGLISKKSSATNISPQMMFIASGILAAGVGLIEVSPENSFVLGIAEAALVLTIFSDATRVGLRTLLKGEWLSSRLLLIGMPLVIVFGTAIAVVLFPEMTLLEAAILGVILAPTDASLVQKVISGQKTPHLVRQGLNVESGLNDGTVLPLLVFFIVLDTEGNTGQPVTTLLNIVLEQVGLGILIGVLIGLAGGWLFSKADMAGWMSGGCYRTGFLALAIVSWLVAHHFGGNAFLSAFAAGLATGAIGRKVTKEEIIVVKAEGDILGFAVFFILGIIAVRYIPAADITIIAYALLIIVVVRVLAVMISLMGTHLSFSTTIFLGWFGPKGLASIVLIFITMRDIARIGISDTLGLVVITTVLISVFAHGISAGPANRWYAKKAAGFPQDAPENEDVEELPTRQGRLSQKLDENSREDSGGGQK